jgi:hypothetical protein
MRTKLPPIELSLPFNRLARMLASFSVRTRIVLLALIPVVGFVANGLTFTAGEGDVGRAFATVTHSTASQTSAAISRARLRLCGSSSKTSVLVPTITWS